MAYWQMLVKEQDDPWDVVVVVVAHVVELVDVDVGRNNQVMGV